VRSGRSQVPEIKVTDVTFDEKYEITDHTILGEVSEIEIEILYNESSPSYFYP